MRVRRKMAVIAFSLPTSSPSLPDKLEISMVQWLVVFEIVSENVSTLEKIMEGIQRRVVVSEIIDNWRSKRGNE